MNLFTKDFSKIKIQYNVCKRNFEWFNTCVPFVKYIKIHNKNMNTFCARFIKRKLNL